MKLLSFVRGTKRTPITTGKTFSNNKDDSDYIKDMGTVPEVITPPVDSTYATRKYVEVTNSRTTLPEAEECIRSHHHALFHQANHMNSKQVKAELNSHNQQKEFVTQDRTEQQELIENSQKCSKKQTSVVSYNWTPVQKMKAIMCGVGSLVTALFGISNLSINLKQNNLVFLDAPWSVVVLSSLVFLMPAFGVKERFDTLPTEKAKEKYLSSLFYTMLGSLFIYMMLFAYQNMPQAPAPGGLFSGTVPTETINRQLVNYVSLLTQIILEISTSTLLLIYASRICARHAVVTDITHTLHPSKVYESHVKTAQELDRVLIQLDRRIEVLSNYEENLAINESIYLTNAVTQFQSLLNK
ncbi:hypothetical protein [Acanthopleuribacter pedis]|uniref:Uncharacterized protein n=1 Tax=Acanthopleuribacter pedis TaxID=442870 RepID=A0A8J7QC82_9BACT|nr:hypothetical protein [Acanthopleuribacter pedis]MBO1318296.1 hypothetical protein [Acanthopleuribacter pedis]